jgi:hypothetical protein
MSPEQANGDAAQVSDKSDIYSLGIILFELLTGACPFDGHRDAVIRQILVREPARPRSLRRAIPRDLETICLKAIEKNPARRYSAANELAADLRSFASGKPKCARRARFPEKCVRSISKRPAAVAILAVSIVVMAASGMAVTSLRKQNRRLEGYRPVYVTSIPSGARVALVPIDPSTNELSVAPEKIIRPPGYTPLMTEAKSGCYFVEAVLPNSEGPMFAEVYRTVADISRLSESSAMANIETGLDPSTCRCPSIVLKPLAEATSQMVKIRIDDQSRRLNPLLPQVLYVDVHQTSPTDGDTPNQNIGHLLNRTSQGEPCITYQAAIQWAELNQKRLASSAEYDAIVKAIEIGAVSQTIDDLFDDRPEYTTTIKVDPSITGNAVANHLHDMHVLKGYRDSTTLPEMVTWTDGSRLSPHDLKTAKISIRGVHSGTPRFVISQ